MNALFKTLVVIFVGVALVAPFSFLKPKYTHEVTNETANKKHKKVINSSLHVLPEDIEPKLHDEDIPNFAAIADVTEKKMAFFNYLKPTVAAQNLRIKNLRKNLKQLKQHLLNDGELDSAQKRDLARLANYYRLDKTLTDEDVIGQLLYQVDTIPAELVLVQAANESAWGTSRFARIGLNFFGLWCYSEGCGMVPNGRDEGLSHEVEKFDTLKDVVAKYFKTLNSSASYKELRAIRAELRAANKPVEASIIAEGLMSYSERGEEYVSELQDMLRHNHKFFVAAE